MKQICEVWQIDQDGFMVENYIREVEFDENGIPILEENFVLPYGSDRVFYKPKYDRSLGDWAETDDVLKHLKDAKKVELDRKCNETILGRFNYSYNGVDYSFSNDAEAQSNFEKVDRAFEKGRMTEIGWTAYDENGDVVRLIFDANTFEPFYLTHLQHIQNNISKFRDTLEPRVDNATTTDEVNAIVW